MRRMDGATLRYGWPARARDLAACLAVSFVGLFIAGDALGRGSAERDLIVFGGLLMASVFVTARWRWSRWASADELGVASGGGPGDAEGRVAWEAVDEITVTPREVVLRGGGAEATIWGDLDGAIALRDHLFRTRAPALFRRLRGQAAAGEPLTFRSARSLRQDLLRAGAWLGLFWLPPALAWGRHQPPVAAAFIVGIALVLLARAAPVVRAVTFDPRGLLIDTLRRRAVHWEDVESAAFRPDGTMDLRTRDGGAFELRADLGNYVILQELILERLRSR